MRMIAILGGLVLAFGLGWVAGELIGASRERHRRYLEEQELITPILASDPEFENVKVIQATGPGGGILMFGTVKSRAARARLQAELVRLFGEPRAKFLMEWDGIAVQPDLKQ